MSFNCNLGFRIWDFWLSSRLYSLISSWSYRILYINLSFSIDLGFLVVFIFLGAEMVSSEGLSSSPSPKQYGVTKPISMSGPTEADVHRSRELEKVSISLFFSLYVLSICKAFVL